MNTTDEQAATAEVPTEATADVVESNMNNTPEIPKTIEVKLVMKYNDSDRLAMMKAGMIPQDHYIITVPLDHPFVGGIDENGIGSFRENGCASTVPGTNSWDKIAMSIASKIKEGINPQLAFEQLDEERLEKHKNNLIEKEQKRLKQEMKDAKISNIKAVIEEYFKGLPAENKVEYRADGYGDLELHYSVNFNNKEFKANDRVNLMNVVTGDENDRERIIKAITNGLMSVKKKVDKQIADMKKKERNEIEKYRWIKKHGSEYLKRRWGRGYNVQKRYLKERIKLELGDGWQIKKWDKDYKRSVEWDYSDRSNPSDKALDIEDVAISLGFEPRTYWLDVKYPYDPDDYYHEDELKESFEIVEIDDFYGYNIYIRT